MSRVFINLDSSLNEPVNNISTTSSLGVECKWVVLPAEPPQFSSGVQLTILSIGNEKEGEANPVTVGAITEESTRIRSGARIIGNIGSSKIIDLLQRKDIHYLISVRSEYGREDWRNNL
ncbi:hypothetical protein NEUTE1DRAFT_114744 [Neurospora tetrasperma FGSC 2508]|uniref:Uncharacterized protein n=1 Tax=Neurospora tetrasperma (strain FGSC 2508 / ATCC MYA-4615 / P0657) TaxID=510951 RepID=F8MZF9_NEUT8|nr:uncharacterized protein NEUTE1DRAFT_114744 [Neurospora tetrasperma FGSC 2508]EGO52849.1 hypothetical protein NEUTE1DRAFT_114744 [Neurospora tetrasperma FGSC 2508]